MSCRVYAVLLAGACASYSQTADNVVLVVNQASAISRRIGEYYVHRRAIPLANVCQLNVTDAEEIRWPVYAEQIEEPIGAFLKKARLQEKVLYLVTTLGVPLRVQGNGSEGPGTDTCAVDSELALLYGKMHGKSFPRAGLVPNPFFGQRDRAFRHPDFPIYLVTRLAGYDFDDVKGTIDRSLAARNRGKFVLDLADHPGEGDPWLRMAATLLPAARVVIDDSDKVLYNQTDVIGYASWGSNDKNRHQRHLGFRWLPGAIVTEFVSTNGRTFRRPPDDWNISTWKQSDKPLWFAGAPQTLTADYIHDGATGCSGHVEEPYLSGTPRPDYLLPAYFNGRNLAESYYLSIPSLSWQNIVVGDPLCALGRPGTDGQR